VDGAGGLSKGSIWLGGWVVDCGSGLDACGRVDGSGVWTIGVTTGCSRLGDGVVVCCTASGAGGAAWRIGSGLGGFGTVMCLAGKGTSINSASIGFNSLDSSAICPSNSPNPQSSAPHITTALNNTQGRRRQGLSIASNGDNNRPLLIVLYSNQKMLCSCMTGLEHGLHYYSLGGSAIGSNDNMAVGNL